MSGPRLAVLVLGLVLAVPLVGGTTVPAAAQVDRQDQPPRMMPPLPPGSDPHSLFDLRRRVLELDKLLSLGSVSRARGLLEELSQHSVLQADLVSRRILLAQLEGKHHQAVDLSQAALAARPADPALWRGLAASLLAVGSADSARTALDRFVAFSPNRRSAGVVAVDMCLEQDRPRLAVSLVDSLRLVLPDEGFLGRQRSRGLLLLDRQEDAAAEVAADLTLNPFNLSLVRTEILDGLFDPLRHARFAEILCTQAAGADSPAALRILAANLKLAGADAAAAWSLSRPLAATEPGQLALLQNVATLGAELDLVEHDAQYAATIDYVLEVLAELMRPGVAGGLLRRRAADQLAEVCEHALESGSLGTDPRAAVERFGELLQEVRRINPSSERLYAAQIQLADYTRRTLGDAAGAARRLERLLSDLDLPTEGVALTRLSLGECYLAAGDTARGRAVLTQLGRDPEFREAAGFAHYHLARLDLAEGHFMTARDRFAVVAMDNPAAAYANDSLELGLAIAEELDNPTGGPDILAFYARTVMMDLLDRPAERVAALESFVAEATLRLDPEEPQHLLERGLFELARARLDADDLPGGLDALRTIYEQHPDGRYPAEAMALEGRTLSRSGRPQEARTVWDRLLAQYPDYLFGDDIRDELRKLP